jgi:hypothetical protein
VDGNEGGSVGVWDHDNVHVKRCARGRGGCPATVTRTVTPRVGQRHSLRAAGDLGDGGHASARRSTRVDRRERGSHRWATIDTRLAGDRGTMGFYGVSPSTSWSPF